MRVNLVSTGNEVLTGEVLDTNASFAAGLLTDRGFVIGQRYTVADDLDELVQVLDFALQDADAVVCCGGLGPTQDDLTAEAVARVLGVDLDRDENILADLKHKFQALRLSWTPNQERQARLPHGSRAIRNDFGTACGIAVDRQGKLLYCLPGPPREFRPMLEGAVIDELESHRLDRDDGPFLATLLLRVFGKGEGQIEDALGELTGDVPGLSIAFRAALPEIHVKLRAEGPSREQADAILKKAGELATERLGDLVFSTGNQSLPEVVISELRQCNKTLAVAESCTGGLVGKLLTDVPGASEVFLLSAVTYANEMKEKLLSVPHDVLEKNGAVSQNCAQAMAEGVRNLSGADIGVAVTGIAGPGGGSPEKPVGTVYFSVVNQEKIQSKRRRFPMRDRDSIRSFAAHMALFLTHRMLKERI